MFSISFSKSICQFVLFVAIFVYKEVGGVKPIYKTFDTEDDSFIVEYLVQKPLSEVKGMMFLAHGCQHQATDWFPRTSDCESCLSLPIERNITETLLSRGYIALAASSQNREHKCWTHRDIEPIVRLISFIYSSYDFKPWNVPLYLLGASSGGAFVAMLSHHLKVNSRGFQSSGACVQIMNALNGGLLGHVDFPPIAFVHMTRDERTAKNIHDELIVLANHKIPVKVFPIAPKPITDDYFNVNGGGLSLRESVTLVRAFRLHGIIDGDRMLKEDPRQSDFEGWRSIATEALSDVFPSRDSMQPDASAVNELMNSAWAMHEIVSDYLEEVGYNQ
jgi:hypothetical protein